MFTVGVERDQWYDIDSGMTHDNAFYDIYMTRIIDIYIFGGFIATLEQCF